MNAIKNLAAELRGPIEEVWATIADDVLAMEDVMGEPTTNREAVATAVDANRLGTFIGDKEQRKFENMISEFGYEETIETLSKEIPLV